MYIKNQTKRIFSLPPVDKGTLATLDARVEAASLARSKADAAQARFEAATRPDQKATLEPFALEAMAAAEAAEKGARWAFEWQALPRDDFVAKPFTQILPGFRYQVSVLVATALSILYGHTFEDELSRCDGFSLSEDWPVRWFPSKGKIAEPARLDPEGELVLDPDMRVIAGGSDP